MHAILILGIQGTKFPLGELLITANANCRLDQSAIAEGLRRHACGDWGNVPPEDAELNDAALTDGDRLLSAYGEGEGRFWIITECDRSVTTILLPEDY